MSIVCEAYEFDEENMEEFEEDEDEENGEFEYSSSPLPPEAELMPSAMIDPHFLSADILVRQKRWKNLFEGKTSED